MIEPGVNLRSVWFKANEWSLPRCYSHSHMGTKRAINCSEFITALYEIQRCYRSLVFYSLTCAAIRIHLQFSLKANQDLSPSPQENMPRGLWAITFPLQRFRLQFQSCCFLWVLVCFKSFSLRSYWLCPPCLCYKCFYFVKLNSYRFARLWMPQWLIKAGKYITRVMHN